MRHVNKMNSGSLVFDDTISDEAYFILRAEEVIKSNIYESKAWLLTAKTLYPQNFNVLFQSYQIDKISANAKEAAESFSALFKLFNSNEELWPEIKSLISALLTEFPTSEQIFLRNIFSEISLDVQHNLLSLMSDRSEDPMEHCQLVLLILQKFPQTASSLGRPLIDELMTAGTHIRTSSCLKCYREMLVGDVIPILLNDDELEWSENYLLRMLYKIVSFYIEFFITENPDGNLNGGTMLTNGKQKLDPDKKYECTWERLFTLLKLFGAKLEWELCSIFSFPCDRDMIWQSIYTFNSMRAKMADTAKATKQLIFCTTVFFIYCLHQYTSYTYSSPKNKSPLILVEAFTLGCGKMEQTVGYKKQKVERPILSAPFEVTDVERHFMFTVNCWELIYSTESYKKEFTKLKSLITLEPWLSIFLPDIALYHGKFKDNVFDKEITMNITINMIRKLSCSYFLRNHNAVIEYATYVIKHLDTIPEMGCMSDELVKDGDRHLYFLPLEKFPVLQYTVKVLLEQLLKSLRHPLVDKNRLHYEIIVLAQLNWPCEKEMAWKTLNQIKQFGSFAFPGFSKYVVTGDLLEEFMYFAEVANPVTLDIIPYSSFKRMDEQTETKGMIKKFLKNQLKRWNDQVHVLIVDFILMEENYFPRHS